METPKVLFPGKDSGYRIILAGVIAATVLIALLSLGVGRYPLSLGDLLRGVLSLPTPSGNEIGLRILFGVRLPRIIVAVGVGGALAGVGCLFQGIFRNPLASPDVLGVAAGSSFGAALAIVLSPCLFLPAWGLAFLFGLLSVFMVLLLAGASRGNQVVSLLLSGIIVSAFFSAALSLLKYMADPMEQLPAIVFWLMGGLHRATWPQVWGLLLIVLPGLALLLALGWKVNIMSLGDEEAISLGVNVAVLRKALISLGTLLVATCVSVGGVIPWVGLVIPHMARILVGANHQRSLPMSIAMGGGFLLLVDNLARTLTPAEIPVGILTALFGAPMFAYLLLWGPLSKGGESGGFGS
jgi:iron complex transport system permease protein